MIRTRRLLALLCLGVGFLLIAAGCVPAPSSGEYPSQSWWDAIEQCESGGVNGWRTGYFGIEADHPIGDLSYFDQLAWAKRIFAVSGPGAWGCSATVGGPW